MPGTTAVAVAGAPNPAKLAKPPEAGSVPPEAGGAGAGAGAAGVPNEKALPKLKDALGVGAVGAAAAGAGAGAAGKLNNEVTGAATALEAAGTATALEVAGALKTETLPKLKDALGARAGAVTAADTLNSELAGAAAVEATGAPGSGKLKGTMGNELATVSSFFAAGVGCGVLTRFVSIDAAAGFAGVATAEPLAAAGCKLSLAGFESSARDAGAPLRLV